jgi:hypothetical protein
MLLPQAGNPFMEELRATAKYIAARGKGILASDESNATTGKRLEAVGVDNTEDNRRAWRELLYTAPGEGAGGGVCVWGVYMCGCQCVVVSQACAMCQQVGNCCCLQPCGAALHMHPAHHLRCH